MVEIKSRLIAFQITGKREEFHNVMILISDRKSSQSQQFSLSSLSAIICEELRENSNALNG